MSNFYEPDDRAATVTSDDDATERAMRYAHDTGFDEGYELGYEDGYADGSRSREEAVDDG